MPPKYKQKFRKKWLADDLLKNWIVEVPNEPMKVTCRFCKCELMAKYDSLQHHLNTRKHQRKAVQMPNEEPNVEYADPSFSSSSLTFRSASCPFETAHLECRLSLFAASHATSIDRLADTLRNAVNDSPAVSNIALSEKKSSDIIKNILSVHFQKDLDEDIGDGYFSLILDESNISVDKMLGVVIVYYSKHKNKVVSAFFTLVQLQEREAYAITKALKNALSKRNLDLSKLLGIATENQNDMVEINKLVYKILKAEIPTLIFFRCMCNSIRSAISYASMERLPKSLEFLVAETYKWFSVPTLRQHAYADLYKSLNVAETVRTLPDDLRFRWLTSEMAVEQILGQWTKLKAHFEVAQLHENCYISKILSKMYENETNIAYLLFYHSILVEVYMVNYLFQSAEFDKVSLLDELILLIQSTASKLLLPTARVDATVSDIEEFLDPHPRLDYKLESKILELRNCNKIPEAEELLLRENCRQFLLLLLEQLKQRLPYDLDVVRKLSSLSVSKALQPLKKPIVSLMEMMGSTEEDISAAEIQWAKLHLIEWNNRNDTDAFWDEVSQYKDASGGNPFTELSQFASKVLILSHSDHEVEKILNGMKMARSKVKDRMDLNMQNALLHVKLGLKRHNKCCNSYAIAEESINAVMDLGEDKSNPPSPISTCEDDVQNLDD